MEGEIKKTLPDVQIRVMSNLQMEGTYVQEDVLRESEDCYYRSIKGYRGGNIKTGVGLKHSSFTSEVLSDGFV